MQDAREFHTEARITLASEGMPAASQRVATWSAHRGWAIEAEWAPINGRLEPIDVSIRTYDAEEVDGAIVNVETRPVTAEVIRKLPIGKILAEGRSQLSRLKDMRETWGAMGWEWPDQLLGPTVDVGRPQRGQELTADDLGAVAGVYRAAWNNGEPVNEAVRTAFYLSKDGAAKRIVKARAAGLLEGIGPKR